MTEYELKLVMEVKDNLTRKTKQAERSLDALRDKLKGVSRESSNTEKSLERISKAVSSLNLKANIQFVANLTTKTWNLGKSLAETAGVYETLGKTTITATKNMKNGFKENRIEADKMYKQAIAFADITPFSTTSVVGGMNALMMRGLDSKQTMNALKRVGDGASAMGIELEQAVNAYTEAISVGEVEQFKTAFGMNKQDIIAWGKGMGLTAFNKQGQLIDQGALKKILDDILEKKFKGAMTANEDTFKAQLSTLQGKFSGLLAKAMGIDSASKRRKGSLLDTIVEALKGINKLLSNSKIVATMRRIFDDVAKVLKQGMVWAVSEFAILLKAYETGGLDGLLAASTGTFVKISEMIVQATANMVSEIFNALKKTDTFGPLVSGLETVWDMLVRIAQSPVFSYLMGGTIATVEIPTVYKKDKDGNDILDEKGEKIVEKKGYTKYEFVSDEEMTRRREEQAKKEKEAAQKRELELINKTRIEAGQQPLTELPGWGEKKIVPNYVPTSGVPYKPVRSPQKNGILDKIGQGTIAGAYGLSGINFGVVKAGETIVKHTEQANRLGAMLGTATNDPALGKLAASVMVKQSPQIQRARMLEKWLPRGGTALTGGLSSVPYVGRYMSAGAKAGSKIISSPITQVALESQAWKRAEINAERNGTDIRDERKKIKTGSNVYEFANWLDQKFNSWFPEASKYEFPDYSMIPEEINKEINGKISNGLDGRESNEMKKLRLEKEAVEKKLRESNTENKKEVNISLGTVNINNGMDKDEFIDMIVNAALV